jgi:hypothetical protein
MSAATIPVVLIEIERSRDVQMSSSSSERFELRRVDAYRA